MKLRSVTMKDVAHKTGFTINTVSHALNDKPDISSATKDLIRQAADELGYIRNNSASSLRSNQTRTIAVVIGDISNPYFGILVREMEQYARHRGYSTFIINTEEDDQIELFAVRSALEKRVDGIILCPNQKQNGTVEFLLKRKIPFVLTGRFFENFPADHVVADDRKGGYLATRYLLGKGNERILFLNGPSWISSARLRLQGYRDALTERGVPYRPELVREITITGDYTHLLNQIMIQPISFTAILAFSDVVAWEILYAVSKSEMQGLKGMEVVGFDNIQSDILAPFPLTSVNYDKRKMAHLAVEILLNRIDKNEVSEPIRISLDTDLIIRSANHDG